MKKLLSQVKKISEKIYDEVEIEVWEYKKGKFEQRQYE